MVITERSISKHKRDTPKPADRDRRNPAVSSSQMRALLAAAALLLFPVVVRAQPQAGVDEFTGAAGCGPYALSWRGFQPGSDLVFVDGARAFRNSDYRIDPDTGLVAFERPLTPLDRVRVEYQYDTGRAQPNTLGAFSQSLDLLRGAATLSATCLMRAPERPGEAPGLAAVGLNAAHEDGRLRLSSLMLVGTGAGSFRERSGLKLGLGYHAGPLSFSGDFARAGSAFGADSTYGLSRSAASLNLQAALALSPHARLTSGWEAHSQGAGKAATATASQVQSLDLTPTAATHVAISRNVQQNTAAGKTQASITNSVLVVQKLGALGSLQANGSAVSGSAGRSQSTGVSLSLAPAPDIAVQTALSAAAARGKPAESSASVKLEAGPAALHSSLALSRTARGRATQDALSAGAEAHWKGGWTLDGALALGAAAGPAPGDTGHTNSAALSLAVDRLFAIHSSAGTQHNSQGWSSHLDTGLVITPSPVLKLSGDWSDVTAPNSLNQTEHGELDLRPVPGVDLSAAVCNEETPKGSGLEETWKGELAPGPALKLDGSYCARSGAPFADADSWDAHVTLSPLKALQFIGGYARNPEENGQVLSAVRRTLGVQTHLGILMLSGAYDLEDRRIGGTRLGTQWGVGLQFAKTTALQALYKLNDDQAGPGNALYSLRFSHDLGPDFNLCLESEADAQRSGATPWQQTLKGSAKLGLRF